MTPTSASSSPTPHAPAEWPDRSLLLIDPTPDQLRAGFRRALERSGACGPRLDLMAASAAADFGRPRAGIGCSYGISWIRAPRPRGGLAVRIFPGPAAERVAPLLLGAIGA